MFRGLRAGAIVPFVLFAARSNAQCDDWFDTIDGYHSTNGPDLIGRTYSNGAILGFPDPAYPVTVVTGMDSFPLLELRETALYALDSAGNPVFGTDFVGTELRARAADGTFVRLRINQITSAPDDRCFFEPNCIHAYVIEQLVGINWVPLCGSPGNPIEAVPIAGTWTGPGVHNPALGTTFACRDGAAGKCLYCHRYLRWVISDQEDLLQSCTRMVRADYCGSGMDNTIGGTPIISGDFLGQHVWNPNPDPPDGYLYEATWGPNGAYCVNAQRHMELLVIQHDHPERCPVVPSQCREEPIFMSPGRILKNKCEPVTSDPTVCVALRP
jgi:hypothetical protein